MCHLREGEDLEAELRDVLPPDELQELLAAPHRPNHCCQVLLCFFLGGGEGGEERRARLAGVHAQAITLFSLLC
jgi:hypothetical protein